MYVCMYKISFAFDTGRSFDWISLKLGRAVVCIEYWCCIVFGSVRPNERCMLCTLSNMALRLQFRCSLRPFHFYSPSYRSRLFSMPNKQPYS